MIEKCTDRSLSKNRLLKLYYIIIHKATDERKTHNINIRRRQKNCTVIEFAQIHKSTYTTYPPR